MAGYRQAATILEVIFGKTNHKMPHHTTVRCWVIRHGYYHIQKPIEKADDWIAIGDLTIQLGKIKCLTILGVGMSNLEQRTDFTLTHKDVEILGLHATEKATGEFSCKAFIETRNRIGCDFLGMIIDQGADIKKGGRLLLEQCPNTKLIHDIPHKLSLVLERVLKDDPMWASFIKNLLDTRRLIAQTELAAMMPPTQRSKARFMDIAYLIEWPRRILECKNKGRLDAIPEERYKKYFGWIEEFELPLRDWKYMEGTLSMIKGVLREFGLSHDTYNYLKMIFQEFYSIDAKEELLIFTANALRAVEEECNKLGDGQVLICSTEVIESVFGKFKEMTSSSQGITGNILGMATYVGPELKEQDLKIVMESCSTLTAMDWIKLKIGNTLGKLRYQFFKDCKETKFDIALEEQLIA